MLLPASSWPATAKLNLFLHLTARRQDGYHQLQTFFQLLDYSDELIFTERSDTQITATCLPLSTCVTSAIIPDADNLAVRAAHLLRTNSKRTRGVNILIKKRIPIGGGLGGGSSNAATTLMALNILWQLKLSTAELLRLGVSLGADVPIFIKGRSSWAEGIGEELHPLAVPPRWFLVIIPPVSICTAKLFSHPGLTYATAPIRIRAFLDGTVTTGNDFEKLVRYQYPVVAQALDFLNRFAPARLSGTGACIFSAFDKKAEAETVLKKIKPYYQGFISKGLNIAPLHETIGV